MQKSVEDEKTWGGSSVALEEMGVAVLAGAYNIESEEVQRRIPSADILAIATRVQELLRTGADAPVDAMAMITLPQVEEEGAGNSDAATGWLAWKEAAALWQHTEQSCSGCWHCGPQVKIATDIG